jgi:hypothetical protein
VAQFRLADARDTVLNQVYAGDDGVYRVQWQVEPGAVTVRVDGCPYRKDGEALQWRAVALATFTPPGSSLLPGGITAGETWTANVENADVSGSWLVCCVEWSRNTKATAQRVAAVYGVHLPTGHAGLMTAWTVRPGHVDAYHVAIGAGKVAVQAEIRNQAGKQPPVGLPVQVYDLQGSDPATALHPSDTVPAPFGVMANPMVTGHGVVFQGIEGHSDPGDTVNATWYLAPFEGEASELLGPPQDGQPHWVVEAADGKLWWAETTPSDNGRFQVLMGPLVPMGQSPTVPAYTLDGTVEAFRADGRWVMWVQTDGQTQQLVVSEVQGGGT